MSLPLPIARLQIADANALQIARSRANVSCRAGQTTAAGAGAFDLGNGAAWSPFAVQAALVDLGSAGTCPREMTEARDRTPADARPELGNVARSASERTDS
jgi:hypothetical protein